MSRVFDIILFLMATFLSAAQVFDLRVRHHKSREKRVCDKIKAILLLDKGYSYDHIAEVLLLDDSTIRRWVERYQEVGMEGLLADYYLGGDSYLTEDQKKALVDHLESNVYLTAKEICAYVLRTFVVEYTYPSGLMQIPHKPRMGYFCPGGSMSSGLGSQRA